MDKKLFGKRLKEIRKNKKLTQQQLAEIVNTEESHVSAWERGVYFPTYNMLEKITKALEVEMHEMFFFLHYRSRDFLLEENMKMLQKADEKQLKEIYHFLSAILAG